MSLYLSAENGAAIFGGGEVQLRVRAAFPLAIDRPPRELTSGEWSTVSLVAALLNSMLLESGTDAAEAATITLLFFALVIGAMRRTR